MGLNGFLIFMSLTRAWDPKRQFWPIKVKLREPFHRQLFRYAENLLYELLSNIHRINCPTAVGCTKIRPLTCCVISLAQYNSFDMDSRTKSSSSHDKMAAKPLYDKARC